MIKLRRRQTQAQKPAQYQIDYVGLLENIFSSINANIAYLDLDCNIVRVNESLAHSSGQPPEHFVGQNFFELYPSPVTEDIFRQVVQTGEPAFSHNTTFTDPRHPERGTTYWSWSLQMIKRVDGQGIGLLLIAANVTDSIRAQKELRESQARFEHLFESDPDANILVDENGKILSINQQTEIDFGYNRDEVVGQSVEILLPPYQRDRHAHKRRAYVIAPRKQYMGFDQDIFGRRRNGDLFPVEIMLSPLQSESGTLILVVVRDISQRKQMEQEIAEVQHRLIESIENERLSLAQDLHDGPIQDLYGVVYMLQGLDSEMYGRASQIDLRSARETTNQVINTLRDVCTNLRPAALTPFGLNRAITSHAEHFEVSHPDLHLHLDLCEDGTLLPESIRLALYRIYQHLLSNVARHAKAQNAWIRFKMEDRRVLLEVRDDGVGFQVPQRYVELVRQGHYGLAGATERAESIGGSVEINTEPGSGTTVRVVVPFFEQYRQAAELPISSNPI